MTTTAKLTDKQFAAAAVVLALATITEGAEVSEYAARTGGARLDSLRALVRKGILVTETKPFVMPTGIYAGQTFQETFYSIP